MVEGRAGRTWSLRSSLREQLLAAAVLEVLWLFRASCHPLVFRCAGHGCALGRGMCWWLSLGGLSEIKPCGRRNTTCDRLKSLVCEGIHVLCRMLDLSWLPAAAVALVAFPGVQRNPYHPPQMEARKGLERGTCPTSLLQD